MSARDSSTTVDHHHLLPNTLVLENMRAGGYQGTITGVKGRVISMATVKDIIVLGTANHGCSIYRYRGSQVERVARLRGPSPSSPSRSRVGGASVSRDDVTIASSCHYVSVSSDLLVYIQENKHSCSLCVHKLADVISGRSYEPMRTLDLQRPAPMVVDFELSLILIGAFCWKSSWVNNLSSKQESGNERGVCVLDLNDFTVQKTFTATNNRVAHLKLQTINDQHLLGVSDTRTGISVYSLTTESPTSTAGYTEVFNVAIEEVRDFQLAGDLVGVFHRFEPNVSFWTIQASQTILCINIQDQLRHLTADGSARQDEQHVDDLSAPGEADDADSGLCDDEDDHVTASVSVLCGAGDVAPPTPRGVVSSSSGGGHTDALLIYGTRSGCVFGMSTRTRSKLFSIPFALDSDDDDECQARLEQHQGNPRDVRPQRLRRDVTALSFLPGGKLAVCYEGYGLALLDFNVTNPSTRPCTRGDMK